MGKKKTIVMGEENIDGKTSATKKAAKKPAKKKAAEKNVEKKEAVAVESIVAPTNIDTENAPKAPKKVRVRGKKYVSSRAMVDKTHLYSIDEAVTLAKKTHYAKFPGSLEANLVLRNGDFSVEVAFPYTTGRKVSVAIATDELLAEVEKGNIGFTALVAHPSMMPKLAKLARILGPKGLMPNPKNGTLTPNPEKRKKELEAGSVTIKTEKTAPLMHLTLGKLSQLDKELAENLRALLKAFPPGKVLKCSISASMGPGIKVVVE